MELQANKKVKNVNRILTWPIFTVVLLILVVAFVLGCFYDLSWSKSLYASNKELNAVVGGVISNIGIEFGFFAIFTGFFSLIIASYVYINTHKGRTIATNIVGILLVTILIVSLSLFSNEWQIIFKNKIAGIIFCPILTILVAGLAFCLSFFFIRKFDNEKVFKIMFWFIIFVISLNVLRFIICITWSRPRPKAVLDETNPYDFRPVWQPDWFKVFDKQHPFTILRQSFPSGHTANAGLCIAFVVALFKLSAFKTYARSKVLLIIAILIMFTTAFGRMLAGWHFLTDVSFGAIMVVVFSIGLSEHLAKKNSIIYK